MFEKFLFLNSKSLTANPFLRISSAFLPLIMMLQAIFSNLLIPKVLMVNLAFERTGFLPTRSSSTLAALVSLSPVSPTLMLRTSLVILISLIGLSDLPFLVAAGVVVFLASLVAIFTFWDSRNNLSKIICIRHCFCNVY